MKNILENEQLTIYLEGEVNSANAEEVEKEIRSVMSGCKFNSLILDMEKLWYISSAGLRIIVRLKQQYEEMKLVKVSEEVYDIFDMVGFQNVINIERI
jgi:anti-anti-sigma factor